MNILAIVSLFAWLPAVIFLFAQMPPRRAVVTAFIVAWLLLPNIGWKFSGIPDYTKMSATIAGVLIGVVAFDSPRLMALRFRWYDIPMIINCLCPMAGSLSLGLGAYEGTSGILDQMIRWGLPYFIGRMYFSDLDGLRQLAMGIIIGGLAYVPPCLLEIRLSPVLETWVYGIVHWEPIRYGGYRPKVFLSSGLELGMWMTCACLLSVQLWAAKTIRTLWGYPFGYITVGLLVTTFFCKSTGAIALLIMGLGTLWMAKRFKSSLPVLLLLAVAPFYTGTRIAGLWSGREVLDVAKLFGEDRAQSLEFRMQNEDILIEHALEHTVFGGGREKGAMVFDSRGKVKSICDGYWIIIFGHFGLVGLVSLLTMVLLPVLLLIRRHPVSTWSQPEVAPAATFAIMLVLIMIDEVSNGMLNPIYSLIMGGLAGLPAGVRRGPLQEAEDILADAFTTVEDGQQAEADFLLRRAIELIAGDDSPEGLRIRVDALEGLGAILLAGGEHDEAERVLGEAVGLRETMAGAIPGTDRIQDLALTRGQFARSLALSGRFDEAIVERRRALDLWDRLAARAPGDLEIRGRRADALNDLAWLMAAEPGATTSDPGLSVRFAEEAVRLAPNLGTCWNTLGVARYRAGDWLGTVEALERSVELGPPGGTAFDHYFLAMALNRLGESSRSERSFERAVAWTDHHLPGHPALARFHEEAAGLMGRLGRSPTEAV
ncbi:tetratricopeptide repeat protein (plasmid) [Tundrisphaera lichenicola]|uniref:tetratricopeptide repeat protein n=1 Tax=Tundrisphaera lichenicola TaxID=2029860 RepID=UPI003EC020DE